MSKDFLKSLLLAGSSGLLLALAYPGWGFGAGSGPAGGLSFLVWIGLIPLFWSFSVSARSARPGLVRGRALQDFFKLGFWAGLVYFFIIFRWFWSIYPLDTLGIQSRLASFAIILILYLVSSAGMAVFWGLAVATANYPLRAPSSKPLATYDQRFGPDSTRLGEAGEASQQPNSNRKIFNKLTAVPSWIRFAAIFPVFEYLRSWGFGFLWWGSGMMPGPHWTMGNLAYSLSDSSFARWLAPNIGIYGIVFIIVFINLLAAKLLSTKKSMVLFMRPHKKYHGFGWVSWDGRIAPLLVIMTILFFTVLPVGYSQSKPQAGEGYQAINFAVIQTEQPTRLTPNPQEILTNFKEELEMLKLAAAEHPETNLVVFPEASDFFKNLSIFLTPAEVEDFFKNLFEKPVLVIAGGRVLDSKTGLAYSRAFYLDTQEDIIGFYDKRLPTPGGEFLPFHLRIAVNLFSKLKVSQFGQFQELSVGQKEISTVGFRYQFNAAAVICSDILSPGLFRQITQNSDVVAGMASYGSFHGNRTIANQIIATTRFRAAEMGKPVITAANMGRSYVVDAYGNVVFLAPSADSQILTGSVHISPSK